MTTLFLLRILIDFGLLILIWMVQALIYPSFSYYSQNNLTTWHKKYTASMAVIVGPLMIGQLAIALYQVAYSMSLFNVLYLMLVFSVWILTFILFVPLHGRLSTVNFPKEIPKKLVAYNWYRTALWNLIFVVTILEIIKIV